MSDKDIRKQQWISALKHVALGSMAALFLVALFLLFIIIPKNKNQNNAEESIAVAMEEAGFDKMVSEAVLNKENAARTFINQPPAAPAPGDNRKVFKIIEAIPHDACSFFPFMIEWGSREEYDKHVPVGYEGLMALASVSGSQFTLFSGSNLYTAKEEIERRRYLDRYDVPMGNNQQSGVWYRVTDTNVSTTPVSGYFEYVGEGKGLYYIAPTYVVGENNNEGIHYKIQAIPRKGSENPKGELYIEAPAYYWAYDHINMSKPDYDSKKVVSWTDNNYDLSFEKNTSGAYRADTDKIRKQETGRIYSDYLLCVEATDSWKAGFQYGEEGNYIVKSASLSLTGDGLYVRIENDGNTDHYSDTDADTGEELAAGYFRLWMISDGICPRYDVEFEKTIQTEGYYYANAPLNWNTADRFYFEYAEAGKGIYSVPFIYAGEPSGSDSFVRYTESLIQVTDNGGRYALTSTSKDSNGQTVYGDTLNDLRYPKDYAKVITKIDFFNSECSSGIDSISVWGGGKGVMLGGSMWNPERGAWVFHPISEASEMDITLLSQIHRNYAGKNSNADAVNDFVPQKTRIYVRSQTIRYRYYCRNGFINNEWFKLLCIGNNPNNPEEPYADVYDFSKSGEENLNNANAKKIIADFDKSYRIEIEQVTLDKLTPEKVKSADLVYISRTPAVNGLVSNWDYMNTNRVKYGEEPLVSWTWGSYTQSVPPSAAGDIRQDTLFTLYDECIYKRNVALILDGSFNKSTGQDYSITKNITKLYYLMNFFTEAQDFANFMPEMYPNVAKDEYTKIHGNTNTEAVNEVAKLSVYAKESGKYNVTFDKDKATRNVTEWSPGPLMLYFQVYNENGNQVYPFTWTENAYDTSVKEGETKYQLGDWIVNFFYKAIEKGNIWKILRNRSKTSYDLTVLPLNADKVVSADGSSVKWVIYGNEMAPSSFDIQYTVLVNGTVNSDIILSNITYTLDDVPVSLTTRTLDGNPLGVPELNAEYIVDARNGFTLSGSEVLNPNIIRRTVTITATDTNGTVASEEVEVIVRETFDLN